MDYLTPTKFEIHEEEFVIDKIRQRGWHLVRGYATKEHCREIKKTLRPKSFSDTINTNGLGPTRLGSSYFNTNAIAISRSAFEAVTSEAVRSLSERYLGDSPILKCSRSYSIFRRQILFDWHADNKSPIDASIDNSKGLVGIIYLDDDTDGNFSLANCSWNPPNSTSDIPSQSQFKNWESQGQIVNVRASQGDLLLFSQDVFHKHVATSNNRIDSFWFQVVGESDAVGETVIINPSFLGATPSIEQIRFLSGGNRINYSNPRTTMNTLGFRANTMVALRTLVNIPSSATRSIKSLIRSNIAKHSKQ